MRLPRIVGGWFLLRGLVRELSGIRAQLTLQTAILTRLADQVAPAPPAVDRETVAADTGLSFVDAADQAILGSYVERTLRDTGHLPTDEELVTYLADEKTVDLHRRLIERDQDTERLAAERTR